MNVLDGDAEADIARLADGDEFRKLLWGDEAATCDCRHCRNYRRRLVRFGYAYGRRRLRQAEAKSEPADAPTRVIHAANAAAEAEMYPDRTAWFRDSERQES